jgi:tetratricopeptide (TPR) repeat protein
MRLVHDLERAREASRQRRDREAVEIVRSVLAADPDNYAAGVHLADLLVRLGRLQEAEAPLRKLVALRPDKPHNLYRLADLLLDLAQQLERANRDEEARRKVEEARELVERALAADLLDTGQMVRVAAAWNQRGEFALAESLLRKSLAVEPRGIVANLNLGYALTRQGRLDEALPYLEEAWKLASEDRPLWPQILPVKGEVHFRLGEWSEARRCFETLVREFPNDPRLPAFRRYLAELEARGR